MALPDTLRTFTMASGRSGRMHSLRALEEAGIGAVSRLPVSLRIVLESMLRNRDEEVITDAHIRALAGWQPRAARTGELPLVVARILLQDFTGVPLLCDLAAMRSAAVRLGKDPALIEPRVPVDLVVDHSVQVDHYGESTALERNMELEFVRNQERYRFIKWGTQAFATLHVVPPGIGIVHQVNLEHLAQVVSSTDGLYHPDTLVGTDSHTTMVNGLGVVGWGVGGIEAEAAMLGQPLHILAPDVVGVHLHGRLRAGVTATDLVLRVTEMLRAAAVVGAFVEFFGAGAAALTVPDRATLANMAPEYGATMGFFPVDEQTIAYLRATGRDPDHLDAVRSYLTAQGLFGMHGPGDLDYSSVLELDLASIEPCVAGPKRPQDRIALTALKERFLELLTSSDPAYGYARPPETLALRQAVAADPPVSGNAAHPAKPPALAATPARNVVEMAEAAPAVEAATAPATGASAPPTLGHGDVLIAAITSCTNTSNPAVMLAAGLLAKHALAHGLCVRPQVKTSLAPGSRVVTDYLTATGLLPSLERLGFGVVGYGCTTCIGNSGPLDPLIEHTIARHDLVCAAVLSGNRNFEARIHASLRANFLMSPPLVVAFAIAGRVTIDLEREPLGIGSHGQPVYLRDIWPTQQEIAAVLHAASEPAAYVERYRDVGTANPRWNAIATAGSAVYGWEPSTYIAEPPFFTDFPPRPPGTQPLRGARALAIFGDSLTTDHISPAGSIAPSSPAGAWLQAQGVAPADFNSYGARRGNHEVMMRGTFANVRIRNAMLATLGASADAAPWDTVFQPGNERMTIFAAATRYQAAGIPTVVFAGHEYGTGSSRDWAAKGPRLLGVRAVVARSFERIHRSNLVGMGILPLQFTGQDSAASLGIRGDELFDIEGLDGELAPQQRAVLAIHRPDGSCQRAELGVRIDTPIEVGYLRHGGILPFALRRLLGL